MEKIGEKIKTIRKQQGLSQEIVANMAKINLRTLQRIEKGETEPHGHTLRSLCDALGVGAENLLDYGKVDDKQFLTFFHLSVMIGVVLPLGDIIVPMILWLTKKDKICSLNEQGISLLNFRICWDIFYFLSLIIFAYMKLIHFTFLSINPFGLIFIINIFVTLLYPAYVAICINKKNKLKLYYPQWITIIK